MSSIPVTVIIMTKNEEKNIEKCIESVKDFSQIIVLDSNSTDRTTEIAKSLNADIVEFTWNGRYPKKKQWALENLEINHDYVLYVDADEEVTPKLSNEIMTLFRSKDLKKGYFVGYDYVFMDKILKHGHQVYKLVLFHKSYGKFIDYNDLSASNMWEVEGHYQPEINGDVAVLNQKMLHNDHDSIFDYFSRHNRYSDWEAHVRLNGALSNPSESQPKLRLLQKKLFAILPFKGLVAFFHSYVLKLGFLDGKAGFNFAFARAVYYWQVNIKMSELTRKKNENEHLVKRIEV